MKYLYGDSLIRRRYCFTIQCASRSITLQITSNILLTYIGRRLFWTCKLRTQFAARYFCYSDAHTVARLSPRRTPSSTSDKKKKISNLFGSTLVQCSRHHHWNSILDQCIVGTIFLPSHNHLARPFWFYHTSSDILQQDVSWFCY
jgi:hypothetical protein